ncbi:hypothetical protein [Streptomyces beihaiensis]|uniref:Uncharacterized protein n=1 Tax=Streptomyces beihaiensis TaxID=2984495 RepID=A0ABT3TYR2_9ACTN|nr:hypothetical protein [Streptomyces beihaiensis]MCX3062198.1 hypothetical protein [Streptomyces beihaiensis]
MSGDGGGAFAAAGAAAAAAAAGAVGASAIQAMKVEGETLTTFKRRVDGLLKELEGSKAAPKHIANGRMPNGRLGAFQEADDLHAAYTHVHTQLENLSKMLALQIEALVTTVDASKTGYDNLDDEVRARLRRIRSESDELLGANARNHGQQGSDPNPKPKPKATDGEAGGL